jgi:hypothetical protein
MPRQRPIPKAAMRLPIEQWILSEQRASKFACRLEQV